MSMADTTTDALADTRQSTAATRDLLADHLITPQNANTRRNR